MLICSDVANTFCVISAELWMGVELGNYALGPPSLFSKVHKAEEGIDEGRG